MNGLSKLVESLTSLSRLGMGLGLLGRVGMEINDYDEIDLRRLCMVSQAINYLLSPDDECLQ